MNKGKKQKRAWWIEPLMVFVRLSSWIIFPLIVALLFGKLTDRVFSIEPYGTLGLTTLSFLFSLVILFRETKKSLRDLKENAEEERVNKGE